MAGWNSIFKQLRNNEKFLIDNSMKYTRTWFLGDKKENMPALGW